MVPDGSPVSCMISAPQIRPRGFRINNFNMRRPGRLSRGCLWIVFLIVGTLHRVPECVNWKVSFLPVLTSPASPQAICSASPQTISQS